MLAASGKAQRRGFALVSAMVFLFVILVLGSSMVQQVVQELNTANRAKKEAQAFNLAEAGIDHAAWRLYNDSSTHLPATWTRSDVESGSFSVTAERYQGSPQTLVLLSTGTAQGWPSQVKVIGKFLPTGATEQNAVFDAAIFSDGDMDISGTFDVKGKSHANGNTYVHGSPTVTGDVSSVGSVSIQGSPNISGEVLPNAARIAMPTIDLQYYRNIATIIYFGDRSFTGTTNLDGVIFVDGDVTINSNFTGKGVIVATGDVHINGSARLSNPATDELAIVSAGAVKINGNCRIEGWIYAHSMDVPSQFSGNGTADIVGGVAADLLKVNGTLKVEYKTPTVELPGSAVAPRQFDAFSWRRVK